MPWHVFPPNTVSDAKDKYLRCDVPQRKFGTGAGRGRGGQNYGQGQPGAPKRKVGNTCDKWNKGNCQIIKCKFRHICSNCKSTSHTLMQCRSAGATQPDPAPAPAPSPSSVANQAQGQRQ